MGVFTQVAHNIKGFASKFCMQICFGILCELGLSNAKLESGVPLAVRGIAALVDPYKTCCGLLPLDIMIHRPRPLASCTLANMTVGRVLAEGILPAEEAGGVGQDVGDAAVGRLEAVHGQGLRDRRGVLQALQGVRKNLQT